MAASRIETCHRTIMKSATQITNGQIFLLTWTAGCLDAISYLSLGQVFTANMTGNTILFGLAAVQGETLTVLRSVVALAGFCLGALFGASLVERNRERTSWTPEMSAAITIEGVLLVIFSIVWLLVRVKAPTGVAVNALIALSALAMGLQSAIARSIGIAGIATTYITGTVTNLMAGIAHLIRPIARVTTVTKESPAIQPDEYRTGRLAAMWIIYVLAAIVTGATDKILHSAAVSLPLLAIIAVILDIFMGQRFRKRPSTVQEEKTETRHT